MATIKRPVASILLSWLAMLGWDLFLHGALLARFYLQATQFLLEPLQAFRRIPLGYAAFILSAILLVWLMARIDPKTVRDAFFFGLTLGALVWGGFLLGLISISTIDPYLAGFWFVGQSIELGIGAVTVQMVSNTKSLRRLILLVVVWILIMVAATVLLQSFGLVPTLRIS